MGNKRILKLESLVVLLLDKKMKPVKGKFKDFSVTEDMIAGIIEDENGNFFGKYGNFKIDKINYSSHDKKFTTTLRYEDYLLLGKPEYLELSGKKVKKVN